MNRTPGIRYGLLVAGVVLAALGGYLGYALYPRFGLPRAAGLGLVLLAAAAGFASFFSPCSFPLLAALLARETGAELPRAARLGRATTRAGWLSVGAAAFVLGLGILIAAGGAGLARSVTFDSPTGRAIRGLVGGLLVLLGLVQTGRIPLDLRRFESSLHGFLGRQAALRRRRPAAGYALFGFGYLAAGFG